jgi:hypothetical protein
MDHCPTYMFVIVMYLDDLHVLFIDLNFVSSNGLNVCDPYHMETIKHASSDTSFLLES